MANGNAINGTHPESDEDTTMDEDRDLDMVVVCSGDLVDEVLLLVTELEFL
jgi:hypothetical protein